MLQQLIAQRVGRHIGSVAPLFTVNRVSSLTVRLLCTAKTGALFTSLTVTVKLLVALRLGDPLSVTTVVSV